MLVLRNVFKAVLILIVRYNITSPKYNVRLDLSIDELAHGGEGVDGHVAAVGAQRPSLSTFVKREPIDFSAANHVAADLVRPRDVLQVQVDVRELHDLDRLPLIAQGILTDCLVESIDEVVVGDCRWFVSQHLAREVLMIKRLVEVLAAERQNFRTHVARLQSQFSHVFDDDRS